VKDPAGFADWLADLELVAEDGTKALEAAWKASPDVRRKHMLAVYRRDWETLKAKAATATKKAQAAK
jgi:hypothetical protein